MKGDGRDVAGRPPRVLVVEPDAGACRELVRILESAGAEVLSAPLPVDGLRQEPRSSASDGSRP
jgi:hypothetical protein